MDYDKVTKLEITDKLQSVVDKYGFYLKHAYEYPKNGIHWVVQPNKQHIPFIITRNLDTIWYGMDYGQQNEPDKWFVVPVDSHPDYTSLKVYCENFDDLEDAIQYVFKSTYQMYLNKIEYNMLALDRIDDWMEGFGIKIKKGGNMEGFKIKEIKYNQTKDWLLNKHYAQRMPSISYSFGLFYKGDIVGVLTVGKPVSHWLCKNLCGEKYQSNVYELNRLVTNDNLPKNHLSYFVSKVLKILSKDDIILVSYSDNGMNHHGYIYQATNWIYTGKTKRRTDKYTEGGKHSRHYENNDKTKHLRKVRHSKYRYVYFTNKKMRRNPQDYLNLEKYPIINEYPKGDNDNYEFGERKLDEIQNRKTDEVFYI